MNLVPLSDIRPGEAVVVRSIEAGHGATRRLLDLGFTPGETVQVLQSIPFRGPVRIRVRGSDIAIGRGMAMKILVERERPSET